MMLIMMLLRWMIIGVLNEIHNIVDMGSYGRKLRKIGSLSFLFFFLYTLYKYEVLGVCWLRDFPIPSSSAMYRSIMSIHSENSCDLIEL